MLNDNLDKVNEWLNVIGHENLFKSEITYLSNFLNVELSDCELLNYLKYIIQNRCDSRYYDFNSAFNIQCEVDKDVNKDVGFKNPMIFTSRRSRGCGKC